MEKKLENLKWKPMWTSHLACIKACLDYLKVDVSEGWLFGSTGHAFILNIHEIVCPSGPTAWRTDMLHKLANNIGCTIEGGFGHKSQNNFRRKQELAWQMTQKAIDEGFPCYGWELEIPEYYVVYGYDDKGYYYSGPLCDSGKGPKPWQDLGDTEIGVLEMYVVIPNEPAADGQTVKEAFKFALEHSRSPEKWIFPKYKAGLTGYDSWIHALETGKAHGMGTAYNAAVWSECRRLGVAFLKEARERLNDNLSPSFDEAISHYEVVAQNLKEVADTFPFHGQKPEHIKIEARRRTAAEALKGTRNAEESGLKALERIAGEL